MYQIFITKPFSLDVKQAWAIHVNASQVLATQLSMPSYLSDGKYQMVPKAIKVLNYLMATLSA